jgi:aminomethyltransferase
VGVSSDSTGHGSEGVGTLKRTPLFELHKRLGGKLVEFGGWEMPVQYTSIMDEHLAVRKAAGIFDISHMGEVRVLGPGAEDFLNRVLTNDIRKLSDGQGQYTLMCNERGGVIDDLYVYKIGVGVYLLVVNASRIDVDVAWLEKQLGVFDKRGPIDLKNRSDKMAAVAVQGPRVEEFVDQLFSGAPLLGAKVSKPTELKKNEIGIWTIAKPFAAGAQAYVSRTGYTGEDGFEVVFEASEAEKFWLSVLSAGHASCVQSCGLGARDTLRTEVCYPLYGNDLNETTTPIEAGLGFFVALDKGEFIGRAALVEQKEKGVTKKCVAFKMTEKSAPPRPHYPIWSAAGPMGEVTSGTQSPSLGIGIGLGYVKPEFAKAGTAIEIEIRGKRAPALVVKKPIYLKS